MFFFQYALKLVQSLRRAAVEKLAHSFLLKHLTHKIRTCHPARIFMSHKPAHDAERSTVREHHGSSVLYSSITAILIRRNRRVYIRNTYIFSTQFLNIVEHTLLNRIHIPNCYVHSQHTAIFRLFKTHVIHLYFYHYNILYIISF